MQTNKGILLESGTNELEIVEFTIANSRFGINVIKVREIIPFFPATKIPFSHPNIEGVVSLRGEVVPVVHLANVLRLPVSAGKPSEKLIITEFNQLKVAFHVENVARIDRFSWEAIEQPNDLAKDLEGLITGIIHFDEDMILLPDFEKIIFDINPHTGITKDRIKTVGKRERSAKKILIAEDSALLRELLRETLEEVGYANLEFCVDGSEAYEKLEAYAKKGDIQNEIQLVITDIEMPKMDGHHLTKRIKEDERFNVLPVIIFSSLITNDLKHKGERVGADAQVSKPEVFSLVKQIDQYIL
ncbi:chemotaxis protein CheV [Pueribacillus theae]|uniref:Chemotaxis protein CheV n=1 Tax=Pueribacillus theae TaxID=2171751 RepID=A0A2U1K3G6_9BACI|nr:chemotaxis protein [Pueribacillus theae]PWA11785.1 chemotaxis protein CheV [Pueribacillus theae]